MGVSVEGQRKSRTGAFTPTPGPTSNCKHSSWYRPHSRKCRGAPQQLLLHPWLLQCAGHGLHRMGSHGHWGMGGTTAMQRVSSVGMDHTMFPMGIVSYPLRQRPDSSAHHCVTATNAVALTTADCWCCCMPKALSLKRCGILVGQYIMATMDLRVAIVNGHLLLLWLLLLA